MQIKLRLLDLVVTIMLYAIAIRTLSDWRLYAVIAGVIAIKLINYAIGEANGKQQPLFYPDYTDIENGYEDEDEDE